MVILNLTLLAAMNTAPPVLMASRDRCELEVKSRQRLSSDFTKELAAEFLKDCLALYEHQQSVEWHCHSQYSVCSPLDREAWVGN